MPKYKVTFSDGTTRNIRSDEEYVKKFTADDGTYELIPPPKVTDSERRLWGKIWRDNTLLETDYIVPLTDHPQRDKFLTYRQKLRDWPSTSDFPSKRPTL